VRLSVKNAATLWKLVKQEKMANTSIVVTGDILDDPLSMGTRSTLLKATTNAIVASRSLPSYF
jgi:hypothetical protein